jgi:AP-4 complex subunit mu-1
MSRFSQFFVMGPRGDTIISRDYRGDVSRDCVDKFFQVVRFWGGKQRDAPPIFFLDGVSYCYVRHGNLLFCGTTRANGCGSLLMELLLRITRVFRDYCGVLTEESIRKNFILLYELLDEICDFGYVQDISTEALKVFVFNEATVLKPTSLFGSFKKTVKKTTLAVSSSKTTPSDSVHKPVSLSKRPGKDHKNEIFVDIFEHISVTFNVNGYALSQSIDGTIQMKSYLEGNPYLKLALNEDLVIGKSGPTSYGSVTLDDCNFHECANLDEFDETRTLTFQPPDGEFAVLNYRVASEFRQPFRIFPFFELVSPYKVELVIKIRADIPEANYGGNVVIELPVPKHSQTVTPELPRGASGQSSEYDLKNRKVTWKMKKFPGGSEQQLTVKISFTEKQQASVRKQIGPISMNFEIPMYNVSGLQVRYLRIQEVSKKYNPYRWVRYVTKSQSYICRL